MRHLESSRGLERWCAIFVVFSLCLLAGLVLVVGSAAATDVVMLQASADTYVRSGAPDTNEGASTFLRLRASGDNRSLVRFDQAAIASAVATGSLTSATLELQITDNGNNWGATGRTISVYRLTSAWAEGNGFVDQGHPPNRGSGPGATWACAIDADISDQGKDCAGPTEWEMGKPNQPELHPWVEPATDSALITNGLTGTVAFDVTADVQAYLSGSAQNSGWIVKKDLEGPSGLVQFASRETGNGPRLVLAIDRPPSETSPPTVASSGAFSALDGQYINGTSAYTEVVEAVDGESGVTRVWIERDGSGEATASAAPCSPACPASYSAILTVDSSTLPEGTGSYAAKARDAAGNIGSTAPWTVRIDRSPPTPVENVRVESFDPASEVVKIGWDPGFDPDLGDSTEGSGVAGFEYRLTRAGQSSEWVATGAPDFELSNAVEGEIVRVDVRQLDAVANQSLTLTADIVVGPPASPPTLPALTEDEEASALEIARSDPRIAALLAGVDYEASEAGPWVRPDLTTVGSELTISWAEPLELEYDWPVIDIADDGTYTETTIHYVAEGVLSFGVTVDLDRDVVVAFEPGIEAQVTNPPQTLTRASAAPTPAVAVSARAEDSLTRNVPIRPTKFPVENDRWYDYDFTERRVHSSTVDWPVNLIFWGDATVDRAKIWFESGSRMWNWIRDPDTGPNFWDEDGGSKNGTCSRNAPHYRVYGGKFHRMFSLRYDFYVIATSHIDHWECAPNFLGIDTFGQSEKAEHIVADAARAIFGPFAVEEDSALLPNRLSAPCKDHPGDPQPGTFCTKPIRDGKRILENNGWATLIQISFGEL